MKRLIAFLLSMSVMLCITACNASKLKDTEPAQQLQGVQVTDPIPTESQTTEPITTDPIPTESQTTEPITTNPTQIPIEPTEPSQSPYGMDADELKMYAEYFDLEKEHRPTLVEILAIQEGTPVSEVVELIGKPHDFAPTDSRATLQWETVEGYTCLIDLRSLNGSLNAKNTFELVFKYCVVDWVVPLVEPNVEYDSTSEKYDEAGIYNATNQYFIQRESYLLGVSNTIEKANPGLVTDEDAHKLAISASGIELVHSDVVVHAVVYWDSHAQAVASETVTYHVNGEEKTETIIHRVQLGQTNDDDVIVVSDKYFDPVANFKSCSYLPPYLRIPQT